MRIRVGSAGTPAEFLTSLCADSGTTVRFTDPAHETTDFVFIGECSREGMRKEIHDFERFVEKHPNAKSVVVLSGCCGNYTDRLKEVARAKFPEITWHFPSVGDLCNCQSRVHHIRQSLISWGIIQHFVV